MRCRAAANVLLMSTLAAVPGGWAETPPTAPEGAPEPAASSPPAPAAAPRTVTIGIAVNQLAKLDVGQGTFTADFWVTATCDREPCPIELDVANGNVMGKPELVTDEKDVKVYRIRAEVLGYVDLSEYPFDQHVLSIMVEPRKDPQAYVFKVDPADQPKLNEIELPGWTVTSAKIVLETDEFEGRKIPQAHYVVSVERPRVSATFKSIVPLAAMILAAAFTLLLKPTSAISRLAAATGGLMTVVMFQVGQIASLPPIGYLTRLDKFMVATYVAFLVNIAFAVLILRASERGEQERAERIHTAAMGAVPAVAIAAWLAVILKFV